MDRITLDFEKEIIIFDTDSQKGEEHCPGLADKKADVFAAIGYEQIDFRPIVSTIERFFNGEITVEELHDKLVELENSK